MLHKFFIVLGVELILFIVYALALWSEDIKKEKNRSKYRRR